MQLINTKASGTVNSITKKPLLIPSYNGTGAITATQSGFLVTVDFGGVAHNLDSTTSGLLNGVGTDVYLKFGTGAIVGDLLGSPTNEIYNNVTWTSTTQFTCLSRISATVSTPQAVTQCLSAYKQHATSGFVIPANMLQVGSAFRVSASIITPVSVVASRNISVLGNTLAASNQTGFFWSNSNVTVTQALAKTSALVQFLSNGSDPTVALTPNDNGTSTTSPIKFASGQNMDITNPITICHCVNFQSVMLNDYVI